MSKLDTLTDTFTGTSLNTSLWTPTGTVSVGSGLLTIGMTSPQSKVVSVSTYDATNSYVIVKMAVTATANATDWPQVYVGVVDSGTGFDLSWTYFADDTGTTLYWAAYSSGEVNTGGNLAYDATAHAYLRISMSGGTITFSTSPDGSSWTTRGTATTANPGRWSASNLVLNPSWNSFGGASAPSGSASFDVVNPAAVTTPTLSSGGQITAVPIIVTATVGKVSWTAWKGGGGALVTPPPTSFPAPAAPSLPSTWAPFP